MPELLINSPVCDFVTNNQHCTSILNEYALDFCCGGQTPLNDACSAKGLDPQQVYDQLMSVSLQSDDGTQNWAEASVLELAQHILDTHHVFVKHELPRISQLVEKVESVYKLQQPYLTELLAVWTHLHDELNAHLQKEEQILFPRIIELTAGVDGSPIPAFHCGSVSSPIQVMEIEHDHAGDALKTMRSLTTDYTIPEDACTTYKLMLQGLEAFEADLHQHVHKENNLLFPKVLELENVLST